MHRFSAIGSWCKLNTIASLNIGIYIYLRWWFLVCVQCVWFVGNYKIRCVVYRN